MGDSGRRIPEVTAICMTGRHMMNLKLVVFRSEIGSHIWRGIISREQIMRALKESVQEGK
jgi:hypothetical protein